jgi:hypothetical protein
LSNTVRKKFDYQGIPQMETDTGKFEEQRSLWDFTGEFILGFNDVPILFTTTFMSEEAGGDIENHPDWIEAFENPPFPEAPQIIDATPPEIQAQIITSRNRKLNLIKQDPSGLTLLEDFELTCKNRLEQNEKISQKTKAQLLGSFHAIDRYKELRQHFTSQDAS